MPAARPPILFPIFADVTALKGVGAKTAALVSRTAGSRVVDLILTPPMGIIDRSYRPKVSEAEAGRVATLTVRVEKHTPAPKQNRRLPYKVLCSDETGYVTLAFFRVHQDWLSKALPEGSTRVVSGKIDLYGGERQIVHPDHIAAEACDLPAAEPVYPLTAGLTAGAYAKALRDALSRVPVLPEWLPAEKRDLEDWPSWNDAVRTIHAPETERDLTTSTARMRLAHDEILSQQLALALIRHRRQRGAGRPLQGDGTLVSKARAALPFPLTGDQESVLTDIRNDMGAPTRMVRLVQGDVGSGKTVVAFLAAIGAIEAGCQAAMMAPTEILARQHAENLAPLCDALGLSHAVLLGRDKGPERAAKRAGVAKGYVDLVIGTHALFSDDVTFDDLGLVIVDEQHRFGVSQRLALQEKGMRADVLVMTATPIPRTLALTAYGDMDVSQIREKPPGRKPVITRAVPMPKIADVTEAIRRAVGRGDQVYWVCPLVADTDLSDLTSAETRAADLREVLGDSVGLVHGRMAGEEKDGIVRAFTEGTLKVLVATTVIEVGVNVPAATAIVIEHAERFGLAQLHQLRGRVGRGDRPATCLLLYQAGEGGLGETAKARLNILRETEDGFVIAEEDLRLRGPGDVLGTAQSGVPEFRFADVVKHASLFEDAKAAAADIVQTDPELSGRRGDALRILLYLYGQDEAAKRLRSG